MTRSHLGGFEVFACGGRLAIGRENSVDDPLEPVIVFESDGVVLFVQLASEGSPFGRAL